MSATLMRFLMKRHRLSLFLCCLVPVLIGLVTGFVYPTYSKERALIQALRNTVRFFGQGQLDIFSPSGAFSFPFQHPLSMSIFAVVAAIASMGLPAGERGRGALDLLLATPLTRARMIRTIIGFQVVAATAVATAAYLGAFVGAAMAGEVSAVSWLAFMAVAANVVGLCLFFGAASLLVSVCREDRAAATMTYGAVVVLLFIIDVTSRLWREGAWLGRLTPYGYLRPSRIVGENGSVTAGMQDASALLAGAVVLWVIGAAAQGRRRSV